jgi:hypothetical protein
MKIKISVSNYRCFTDAHPARFEIGPGFTAFVGVNNSGKSSLLRLLYDFRDLFKLFTDAEVVRTIAEGKPYALGSGSELRDALSNLNSRPMRIGLKTERETPDTAPVELEITYNRDASLSFTHVQPEDRAYLSPSGLYPDAALESLMNTLGDAMYVGPFRNILNFSPAFTGTGYSLERPVYHDVFMGQQFVDAWKRWKLGRDRSGNELAWPITEDLARIFGLKRLEINASEADRSLKIFIDGKSYQLEELGSGLAQFIVVLTNAAFRKPAFILIDEPELNLHPALQLDFLTTLASYARVGVVFATHNLGLARSVGERIYSTTRIPEGSCAVRRLEATPRLPEFLGELSFSAHRELGFDKLLLVEGATEVPTMQQFLRKLGKEREVMLLPLGGAATINGRTGPMQLEEVLRITPQVHVLIDSERTAPEDALSPDRAAFVDSCKALGIPVHVLERRATENYLSERAIQFVKGSEFRALEPFQPFNKHPNRWGKAENWKIAAEMTKEEILDTDLGKFLATL